VDGIGAGHDLRKKEEIITRTKNQKTKKKNRTGMRKSMKQMSNDRFLIISRPTLPLDATATSQFCVRSHLLMRR
jgi:hypothetical protein